MIQTVNLSKNKVHKLVNLSFVNEDLVWFGECLCSHVALVTHGEGCLVVLKWSIYTLFWCLGMA
jgi:hypothetical protein